MSTDLQAKPRPKRLGKYRLLSRIGSGGMSRVYRAVAVDSVTEIALKMTSVENDDDVEVADYQREFIVGHRLQGTPNVICPMDFGCVDGYYFITMPLVEGATLSNSTRLRDPSRKPSSSRSSAYHDEWILPLLESNWVQIARLGIQLSRALVACHEKGVIHRDTKPGNIMMNRTGDAYLMDFGLAWMHRGPADHELVTKAGTARYLPPEVFQNRRDERSDIYSLGLTLHELTTGLKVWGHVPHEEILQTRPEYRVPAVRSVRNDVPRCLADCIDKASADEPDERYQSAESLLKHFEEVSHELESSVLKTTEHGFETMTVGTDSSVMLTENVWFNE